MSNFQEMSYWITIAHLPRWGSEKINKLVVSILHDNQDTFENFFSLNKQDWKHKYNLNDKEISDLIEAKGSLPNNSFLAEDLISQGYEVIPINSQEYSPTLKSNLKAKYSPPILYVKGNKQLLQENSIAIVGSRDAAEISLEFTDNIAKKASEQFNVVVSGFAKGVDKQALDSALKYNGQSIIVLPQGILTYSGGIKKYYKQIVEGNVLVLSTFQPNAVWGAGLAMARNPIIYGLAKEIYAAQSSSSGGTWEGVKSGLKMGRIIYVRNPGINEKNANLELIKLGAKPVDLYGNILPGESIEATEPEADVEKQLKADDPLSQIIKVLEESNEALMASEIKKRLGLKITTQKISGMIKNSDKIIKVKGKPVKYTTEKSYSSKTGFSFDEAAVPEMNLNEEIKERIENATLEILSLAFKYNDEWKFICNNKIISAKLSDNNFWNKIEAGVTGFTKGDTLFVNMKIIETGNGKNRFEILEVLQHNSKLNEPGLGL